MQARGGELYVFADGDSEIAESEGVHILRLPEHYGELLPILHVIPLQLLSYHAALVKGTDETSRGIWPSRLPWSSEMKVIVLGVTGMLGNAMFTVFSDPELGRLWNCP